MDKNLEQDVADATSAIDTATAADDAATIDAAQDKVDAEIGAEDLATGEN